MLNSKQVETMLIDLHGVGPAKVSAFRARLKELRKLDWPRGVRLGRGIAASYSLDSILQLALCVECEQVGLSSQRAIDLLDLLWSDIRIEAAVIASRWEEQRFICFDPRVLIGYLDEDPFGMGQYFQGGRLDNDPAFNTFRTGSLTELEQQLAGAGGVPRRLALIDLSALVRAISDWLQAYHGVAIANTRSALKAWPEEDVASDIAIMNAHAAGDRADLDQFAESVDGYDALRITVLEQEGYSIRTPNVATGRRICSEWGLSKDEAAKVLGVDAALPNDLALTDDQRLRVGLIAAIFTSWRFLVRNHDIDKDWLNEPKVEFGDLRPTEFMKSREGLTKVDAYLSSMVHL